MLKQLEVSASRGTSKMPLLAGTGIAKRPRLLELFLAGEFGEGGMTVKSFCAGDKLSYEAFPCVRHNTPLIASLEALSVAF